MRNTLLWLVSACLSLQLTACSGPGQDASEQILRVGLLPDENKTTQRQRHLPLFQYLSQKTGLSFELITPDTYTELLTAFGGGQIDLAYFGGVTFVKAYLEYGATPLVMRDLDTRFTSMIVATGSDFSNLNELQGQRFSFGSRLSTSGHLMPRHFLQAERGVTPETYFRSVQYSGKHDRTAYWVRDGKVDAGAVNSEIIRRMLADGRLRPGDIRIVWTTPPYPDYVWAVHPQVSPENREQIEQAFLQLSADNPQHAAILSNLSTIGFFPASIKDFSMLKQVMASLGVL